MGFRKVYQSLREVFPQIDARALRAVAIEHSKDADAAVEAVLMEIVPFFRERSTPNTSLSRNTSVGESSGAVSVASSSSSQSPDHASANRMGPLEVQAVNNTSGWEPAMLYAADNGNYQPIYDTYDGLPDGKNVICRGVNILQTGHTKGIQTNEASDVGKISDGIIKAASRISQEPSLINETELSNIANRGNELKKSYAEAVVGTESLINETELSTISNRGNVLKTSYAEAVVGTESLINETELSTISNRGDELKKSFAEAVVVTESLTEDDQKMSPFNNSVKIHTSGPEELDSSLSKSVGSQMEMESSSGRTEAFINSVQLQTSDSEELDAILPNNGGSQLEMESSTGRSEDLNSNDSVSHASQTNNIEILEQVIADARNNKTTLLSSMEHVINLMRTVELKEQAAEQAKVEAAMGCNDILVKVEELKQIIHHATEANSMHAGEVYGEKSILASELRELQSRVLSLSDERDKSLDVLDEMHNALEVRLAEAEQVIESAEKLGVEKEKAALEALAAEELIMEKVVQESKILQQQAEENTKLQEFLVDRGRLVDMLQGEIAVICQDVRLLKEKFDENIPFSKALSSGHTSYMLASSSVSSPNEVEPVSNAAAPLESPKATLDVYFDAPSKESMAEDSRKELVEEDGWELCDSSETLG